MIRTLIISLVFSTALVADEFSGDVPHFVEQAEDAGITHEYTGDFDYFVGGGAASFDCNADRLPDLFIAGGASAAGFYINRSEIGGPLSFEKRTLVDGQGDPRAVTGAYPINLNNDEYTDLVVLRFGENQLYQGGEDCGFTLVNADYGFDGGAAWTTGFSAIWEEGADHPTLAFANYIRADSTNDPWGNCDDNVLVRGQEGPLFQDVTALSPSHCSLSAMFTDWNGSGKFDLRVTNDRQYHRGGQEQLWSLEAGKTPRQYDRDDGWRKLVIWGMGIAQADVTGDGRPEYALSSMGDTMLQTLDEDADRDTPVYRDIAAARGSTAHRPYTGGDIKPSTGWHTQFADFNNDARTDLFIAKGNVEAMPDFATNDPDNLLLHDHTGQFVEQGAAAGIGLPTRGRGAVAADFNADGMVDLLVVNRRSPVSLFRNQGRQVDWGHTRMGNFLAIELQNGAINPDAIGAKISVKTGNLTQSQTVQIGGGHASGQLGFIHFGLGVAERAQIRIQWPNGDQSPEYRVFANSFVVITKDQDLPQYWYPE